MNKKEILATLAMIGSKYNEKGRYALEKLRQSEKLLHGLVSEEMIEALKITAYSSHGMSTANVTIIQFLESALPDN